MRKQTACGTGIQLPFWIAWPNVGVMSLGTITLVPMRLVLHGTKEEYIPQFTFFQSGMVMGCLKFYGIITFFRSPCAVEACSFQLYKQCPLEATTWPFKVGQLCFFVVAATWHVDEISRSKRCFFHWPHGGLCQPLQRGSQWQARSWRIYQSPEMHQTVWGKYSKLREKLTNGNN